MSFGSAAGRRSNSRAPGAFETFLEGWIVRQEHYLDELLSTQQNCRESREDDLEDLVSRVLSHYQQYYSEKVTAIQCNVFLVFSPPWFTSFECTFLWIAGFKPGLAFRLVNSSVNDLSDDQSRRMSRLNEETKIEEKELAEELARIQESMAAMPMLELARRARRPVNGEVRDADAVMESLRSGPALGIGKIGPGLGPPKFVQK